ncbi:MAG: hypothetical protein LBS93_03645 [Synergistaceae bacterium]|jgi:hypothetical protein|nr:hypothetical protein [Synergistaceae bacterium]
MLEIYFTDGQSESFGFQVSDKEAEREILKCIKALNKAVTGKSIDDELDEEFSEKQSMALPGTEYLAETLKETVDTFKSVFGFKVSTDGKGESSTPRKPEKVAKKCACCGAPISGKKGQIVHCEYCNTGQQL